MAVHVRFCKSVYKTGEKDPKRSRTVQKKGAHTRAPFWLSIAHAVLGMTGSELVPFFWLPEPLEELVLFCSSNVTLMS